jgi:hypothetical protein
VKPLLLLVMSMAAVAGMLAARWSEYPAFAIAAGMFCCCYSLLWRGFDLGRHDRF